MDPFAVIILGSVGGLVVALLLIGRFTPGSGADQVDWKPTRSVETEMQNEIDDLDQMLAATNRRRRARGEADLTEESLHRQVSEDLKITVDSRDDYLRDLEVVQVLEAKNRRRRDRGLPELSLEEFRASLGGDS
jgi:hypothetical protein